MRNSRRDDHEVGDQRRPAVRDERQRHAGQGDHPDHAADDHEGLHPDDGGEAGGEQLRERAVGLDGDAEPAARRAAGRACTPRPSRADRAPRRWRTARSRSTHSGSSAGCPGPARSPRTLPNPSANNDCTSWKPVVCDTDHGSIHELTRSCTWPKSWYATKAPARNMPERDDEVRPPLGGDVEHRREDREEEERRSEVLLPHHDQDRERPGEHERTEVLRIGEADPPEVPGARGQQLTLVDEVRGEEHHEQHLGRLAGLEVDRPHPHPQPGAVDLAAETRERRQEQRGDAEQQERVLVPLERADVAHDDERDHERADADRGPDRLHPGEVAVESRDDDVADPVEQERDRQQRRVGAGREPADREVCDHVEAEDGEEEHPQVGRDVRPVGEQEQHVARGGHDDREQAEPQLAAAPAAGRG